MPLPVALFTVNRIMGDSMIIPSGLLAPYTGGWPTSWSSDWPSCYLFEAVAVFSFGMAWFVAALDPHALNHNVAAGEGP